MSFVYGNFDTSKHPWLTAKLQQWPAFQASATVFSYPRGDGGYYRAPTMGPTEWKFNLEITASNWAQAQIYVDQVSAELFAHRAGLAPFTPEGARPWEWQVLCTNGPAWKRDKILWFGSQGVCRLSAEITFKAVDPYGYAPEEKHLVTDVSGISKEYKASGFTLPFYPQLRMLGNWSRGTTLQINQSKLTSKGIPDGSTIVLDYGVQDYYYQDARGNRLGSVVDRLTNFTRMRSDENGTLRFAYQILSGVAPSQVTLNYRRRKL